MKPGAGRFVGVDVVDLDHPRCVGRHRDPRFRRRILAEPERELVSAASDPAMMLWRLWAAKEAAYKVVSKVRSAPPPFVHAAFRVSDRDPAAPREFGAVSWEDQTVRVHWHEHPGRIAAVGWNEIATEEPVEWGWGPVAELDPAPTASFDALLERLTARERRPVHSRGSLIVRLAARAALATALDVAEARVQVVCGDGAKGRMPPEVLLDDESAPVDVSLSHHGRWLAWAIRMALPKDQKSAGS
jgi:phosphopantetheinyl transferase (holo-ACP synthase)